MQYIKAAQVLLAMWRFHIQSDGLQTDGIYTLKRRKAELVSIYITL